MFFIPQLEYYSLIPLKKKDAYCSLLSLLSVLFVIVLCRLRLLKQIVDNGVDEHTSDADEATDGFQSGNRLVEDDGRADNHHHSLGSVCH